VIKSSLGKEVQSHPVLGSLSSATVSVRNLHLPSLPWTGRRGRGKKAKQKEKLQGSPSLGEKCKNNRRFVSSTFDGGKRE